MNREPIPSESGNIIRGWVGLPVRRSRILAAGPVPQQGPGFRSCREERLVSRQVESEHLRHIRIDV